MKADAGRLYYVGELLKAMGRIVAGIALLHFRQVFWALRLALLAEIVWAGVTLVQGFRAWMLIGLALAALGAVLIVWTHSAVTRTPVTTGILLTSGPFAVVRHPMYSGWCLAALGLALVGGSGLLWALAAVQTVIMLSVSCAEDEENAAIFGTQYEVYSRKVYLTGILLGLLRLVFVRRKPNT